MKLRFLFTGILFILFSTLFAQEAKKTGYTFSTVSFENILYWKTTDKLMTSEELLKLREEIPRFTVEPVYNKYGQIEKYYYDPNEPFKKITRNPDLQPKLGGDFPEFFFKTLKDEEFSLEELKGKWIFLYFRNTIKNLSIDQFQEVYEEIQLAKEVVELESFAIFSYEENLESTLEKYQSEIHLVNNGVGYFQILHLTSMPTSFLIDPEGKLVAKFEGMSKIKFSDYIKDILKDQNSIK